MQQETREWLAGLVAFVADRRAGRRPSAAESAAAAAAERAIVAASLVSWFDDWTAVTAARRRWAGGDAAAGRDPDPALVLTTSAGGIEAAVALLGGGHPLAAAEARRIVAVTELEYRLWCIAHPDAGHRRHVNHWSWIKTRVPAQREAEFAAYPLGPGEARWLLRTGTSGAGAADRRDCHLWKWNGRHATLLQAFIPEGVVSHFVAPPRPDQGE
jgi:hypothetical protein